MYNVALSPLPLSRSFISLITIVEFVGASARRSAVSCESVASENNPSVQPLAFRSRRMLSGMLAHGGTPLCRYANHERGFIACLLRAIYVIRSMDDLQEVYGAMIMRV